jgi:hypothetical protein
VGHRLSGAACVVALVDRFTRHCHTLDIDGDSWQQRPENSTDVAPSAARRKKPHAGVKKKDVRR